MSFNVYVNEGEKISIKFNISIFRFDLLRHKARHEEELLRIFNMQIFFSAKSSIPSRIADNGPPCISVSCARACYPQRGGGGPACQPCGMLRSQDRFSRIAWLLSIARLTCPIGERAGCSRVLRNEALISSLGEHLRHGVRPRRGNENGRDARDGYIRVRGVRRMISLG